MNETTLPPLQKESGGMMEVLRIATPLVLASAGHAVNLFTDRMMLGWYSDDAVSAAFPAGVTAFAICCFFVGTVGYTNSFVAQYVGAGRNDRVGVSVWQGIFLALIGGFIMTTGYFWAQPLFDLFRHEPGIRAQEVTYFRILTVGSVIPLLIGALSSFWTGRGKTNMIMIVNFIITGCNVPLNYMLIFGHGGLPEMGIAGAAFGTLGSELIGLGVMVYFFFIYRKNRETYKSCTHIIDWELFRRLVKFGAPSGIQLFLDLGAFTALSILLACYSGAVPKASSIAFALNSIAFIPMIGIGMTVSIIVGHSVGSGDIPHAVRSVKSARNLTLAYMALMILLFVAVPEFLINLFGQESNPITPDVMDATRKMIYFIAAYLLFDALFIVYSSAIKGAGDTNFSMWVGSGMAWGVFAIPSIIAYNMGASVWVIWSIMVAYVMICGCVFYLRYCGGKWKKMRVIEEDIVTVAAEESFDIKS